MGAAVACLVLLAGCGIPRDPGHTLERARARGELVVGVSPAPPHVEVGEGEPTGPGPDFVRGFAATQGGYPGALFASAGGYHHHIAMNTWNSRGSGPRAASLGLGDVAVTVPTAADLQLLTARLGSRRIPFSSDGRSVAVTDPWGTQVTVSLPDLSTDELIAR